MVLNNIGKVGKELFFYEALVENHFVPFSFLLLLR